MAPVWCERSVMSNCSCTQSPPQLEQGTIAMRLLDAEEPQPVSTARHVIMATRMAVVLAYGGTRRHLAVRLRRCGSVNPPYGDWLFNKGEDVVTGDAAQIQAIGLRSDLLDPDPVFVFSPVRELRRGGEAASCLVG